MLVADPSGHQQAAVHRDNLTDQVIRIGGSQERYHCGDLLRGPFPPQGYRLRLLLPAFGGAEPVVEGRRYAPGRDRVDQDALRSEFLGHRPGQGFHAALGRCVSHRAAPGFGGDGRDIYDPAPTPAPHERQGSSGAQVDGLEVDTHGALPQLLGTLFQGRSLDYGAALFTSTSRPPNRSLIFWAIFSTSSASATSPRRRSVSLPRAPTLSATSLASSSLRL